MDRERIFGQLRSFDHEGLDEAAFERGVLRLLSGDFAGADDVHAHFLARPRRPGQAELSDDGLRQADDCLKNVFEFYGEQHFVGDDIDWDHNPGTDHWVHDLNRFTYLNTLIRATTATGDEKYARKAAQLVLDWVDKNPVTRSWFWRPGVRVWDMPNGAWRSYLNITIHTQRWAELFEEFVRFWTPRQLLRVLKSIHDQLGYLELVIPTMTNNWVVIGADGILGTAVRLPELRDRRHWIDYAWDKMAEAADRQVLPDGVQFELTPGYHCVVVRLFCHAMAVCRETGIDVTAKIENVTARMLDYQMQTITPDDHLLPFNDTDPGSAPGVRRLLAEEGTLHGRRDWLYVGTRGEEGTPPSVLSQAFEYGGVYVMRTGWTAGSTYLAFDGGPWGYSHQHDDRLGFWLSAHGRPLLIDPGRYLYDSNNPFSRDKYLNTTRAHNTITVDGESQADRHFRETWQPKDRLADNTWLVNDTFQRVAGSHKLGYGKDGGIRVEHRRSITFWPPNVFLVLDRLTGDGEHEVQSRLHFYPGDVVNTGDVWHTTRADANIAVLPIMEAPFEAGVVKGQLDPTFGWYSERVNQIEPSPTLIVCARSQLPLRGGFLLVAYKEDVVPAMALVSHDDAAWLTVDGTERTLSYDDAMR